MARTIILTQRFSSMENVMSHISSNDEALLRLLMGGVVQAGASATSGRFTVQDSDFSGFNISVVGSGLTTDIAGRLVGGTINRVDFIDASGSIVGTMRAAGGLGYDVAGYRAVMNSPSFLPDYFGPDSVSYDASSVATSIFFQGVRFTGGFGQDTIIGSAFGDALSGSHGDDTIKAGDGADVIYGDDLGITMVGFDETGNDALFGEAGDDMIYGYDGSDKLYGGMGNDRLIGDLIGQTGHDTLIGGTGNDAMWGGAGNDVLNGGTGYDRVAAHLQESGDFVYNFNLATGVMTGQGTDTLISVEGVQGAVYQRNAVTGDDRGNGLIGGRMDDTLSGGGGDDRVQGLQGADRLVGGRGADLLGGGEGIDTLVGGTGADRFLFTEQGSTNADRITDFTSGSDTFVLALGIGAGGALGAAAFKRIDTGTVDADDRVLYNRSTGEVFVDADGSGAQAANLLATVKAGLALSAANFVVAGPFDLFDFT